MIEKTEMKDLKVCKYKSQKMNFVLNRAFFFLKNKTLWYDVIFIKPAGIQMAIFIDYQL